MNSLDAPTLLVFLLKGTAVLLGGTLAAWAWRKNAAAWLSTLWRAVFLALLALTPWLLLPGQWSVTLPAAPTVAESGMVAAASGQEATTPPALALSTAAPAAPIFSAARTLWVIYALGVAGCLLPWLIGHRTVRHWARAGHAPANPAWSTELARLDPDPARLVRLRVHDQVPSPGVTGWRHPVLLLPPSADALPDTAIRTILRHELCHVRRGDAFFQALTVLGRALHWPNPLAWRAARQANLAAERAADDAVLAAGLPAREYGRLLAALAAPVPVGKAQALSSMARPCSLETRLRHALNPVQPRQTPSRRRGWLTMALALVLAVGAGNLTAQKAESASQPSPENAAVEKKLKEIVLPSVVLDQASLKEASLFLQTRSKQSDVTEPDEAKRGVRFEVIPRPDKTPDAGHLGTLYLTNVPLEVALKAICDQAQTTFRIENGRVLVSPFGSNKGELYGKNITQAPASDALKPKLRQILPRLVLDQASFEETVGFLRVRLRELDQQESDPKKKGVNFILRLPAENPSSLPKVTLNQRDITFEKALDEVCRQTGMEWRATEFAVIITPAPAASSEKTSR